MFKNTNLLICAASLFFLIANTHAQPSLVCKNLDSLDVEETSLEQLMDVPIVLNASQQAACTNEAANVVTLLSSEEILNSGARDLIDLLQRVPGFSFGVGINNTLGLGFEVFKLMKAKCRFLSMALCLPSDVSAQRLSVDNFRLNKLTISRLFAVRVQS